MSLKGKYALIIGSSRGIGRGFALKLAEQGVKVRINHCRNEAAAKDALAKVRVAVKNCLIMVFSFVLCLTGLAKPSQDNAEYINSGTAIWPSLATKGATLLGIRFE
jgi:NAD(P)-dependent dehydrogenase (short-subunit alcohol dehydrogenase family)